MNTNTHCIFPVHYIIHVASQIDSKIISFDKNFGPGDQKKNLTQPVRREQTYFLMNPITHVKGVNSSSLREELSTR